MGRLFWKFFLAFQGTQLLLGGSVGLFIWLHADSRQQLLNRDPRSQLVLQLAAQVLRQGGETALRRQLQDYRGPEQILVVDAGGRELLDRPLDPEPLAAARQMLATGQANGEAAALQVLSPAGQTYLLYMPPHSPGPRPPPEFRAPLPDEAGLRPPLPGMEGAGPSPGPRPLPWFHILAGLLASLAFSALLAWYVVKPIRQLQAAFRAVASGRLDTRVGAHLGRRHDEFAQLGEDFDAMAQQLESLITSQRRLFHDVSHELRSPLARLEAAIGLAQQNPEKMAVTLERVTRETRRMDGLVGELLTLARLESGMPGPMDEAVDVAALLQGIVEDASFEASGSGCRVEYRGPEQAWVRGREELLGRALENVIRNALKYSPPGGLIDVKAAAADGWLRLNIGDQGPGVPPEALETIFKPFCRAHPHSHPNGYGLGLAIARRALETHGGRITAENRPGGGLLMQITLPLLPKAP